MKIEEALRILDPDTSAEALNEIEYYAGFKSVDAINEAINEACIVACEALNKQIPKAVRIEGIAKVKALDIEYNEIHTYKCIRCPECGKWIVVNVSHKYCEYCGQKIDWSEIGGDEE